MAPHLGLISHPCGHQTPCTQRGKRSSPVPCDGCRNPIPRVCDWGHDHPVGDWSYEDCQAAARIRRGY